MYGELIRTERLKRWTRAEYDRLVELGVFEGERVELLRGVIVAMSPQSAAHSAPIQQATKRLVLAVGDRADVRVRLPLALSDEDEPEPDFALVPPGDYAEEQPTTAFLVIEVAVSSLDDDRDKAGLYAAGGVPEYWIVDVARQRLERYAQPLGGEYGRRTIHGLGEVLRPEALKDVAIAVDDLLVRA